MPRPSGKTFRQQIGKWPRHRAIFLEVRGEAQYPDSGGSITHRDSVEFHAINGEGDAALRRGAHKALDEALDVIMLSLVEREEWVVWRQTGATIYTVAHKVARRTPRYLRTVCMAVNNDPEFRVSGGDPMKNAIFGGPQLAINWGTCKACAAGVTWKSPEGEALFAEMLNA